MHDALPLDSPHRPPRIGMALRHAWRSAGRALARLNGTTAAASLHASDIEQLRRAMRD